MKEAKIGDLSNIYAPITYVIILLCVNLPLEWKKDRYESPIIRLGDPPRISPQFHTYSGSISVRNTVLASISPGWLDG